jgi:hypothetical protein
MSEVIISKVFISIVVMSTDDTLPTALALSVVNRG